jgi:hypothetical protein
MTRFRLAQVAIGAYIALVSCQYLVLAQDNSLLSYDSSSNFSDYEQRFADLEAELQSLRNSRSSGCGTCCRRCPEPHLDAGAEVVFLAPHSTTGLGPSGIAFFPSDELFASWRTWLGYTGSNGLGLRARYWEFDHLVTNNINVFTYDLDTYVADLELTYFTEIGRNWEVLLSGGVRHVSFDEERTSLAPTVLVNSDLTGVVIGSEVARDLTCGLRGYGIARAAAVFGDMSVPVIRPNGPLFDNRLSYMWESQLGLEYCRDTCMGELSLRLGAEVQYWDDMTYKFNVSEWAPESIGFVGIVTGFTLRY